MDWGLDNQGIMVRLLDRGNERFCFPNCPFLSLGPTRIVRDYPGRSP